MIICPFCGAENIEGVDVCAQCGQSLVHALPSIPATQVEKRILEDRVDVLNPRPVMTVDSETSVADVIHLLESKNIGCLFITAAGTVIGVFTERDALMRLNTKAGDYMKRPIADFMTPNPRTLPDDSKMAYVVRMMDQGGIRHILLIDKSGAPTGVISVRDVLRYLAQSLSKAP